MTLEDGSILRSIPRVLLDGSWKDIGFKSSIRIVKNEANGGSFTLQHRFNGKVFKRPIAWLTEDKPLLCYALREKNEVFSC
jgi:hypothetical protein